MLLFYITVFSLISQDLLEYFRIGFCPSYSTLNRESWAFKKNSATNQHDYNQRKLLEAIHIKRQKQELNRDNGYFIPPVYAYTTEEITWVFQNGIVTYGVANRRCQDINGSLPTSEEMPTIKRMLKPSTLKSFDRVGYWLEFTLLTKKVGCTWKRMRLKCTEKKKHYLCVTGSTDNGSGPSSYSHSTVPEYTATTSHTSNCSLDGYCDEVTTYITTETTSVQNYLPGNEIGDETTPVQNYLPDNEIDDETTPVQNYLPDNEVDDTSMSSHSHLTDTEMDDTVPLIQTSKSVDQNYMWYFGGFGVISGVCVGLIVGLLISMRKRNRCTNRKSDTLELCPVTKSSYYNNIVGKSTSKHISANDTKRVEDRIDILTDKPQNRNEHNTCACNGSTCIGKVSFENQKQHMLANINDMTSRIQKPNWEGI